MPGLHEAVTHKQAARQGCPEQLSIFTSYSQKARLVVFYPLSFSLPYLTESNQRYAELMSHANMGKRFKLLSPAMQKLFSTVRKFTNYLGSRLHSLESANSFPCPL